jgi:hypothetical protein
MNIFENAWETISGQKASKKAADVLKSSAAETQTAYKPYQKAGQEALGRISDIMSGKTKVDLSSIPGYTASLEAGTQAIRRQASAHGTMGGGTLAELFGFGQQYAGKAFSDYMGRLAGLATTGYQATGAITGAGQQGAQAEAGRQLGNYQTALDIGKTAVNVGAAAMTGGASLGAGGISGMLNAPSLGGSLTSRLGGMMGGGSSDLLTATPDQLGQSFTTWG